MKKINSALLAFTFVLTMTLVGSVAVSGQETMMKSVGDKVANTSKKVYKRSRRVGTTVGNRTWTGSKWVASKTWKGGKWVAVKTVNGTKWVYRRGKNAVRGARKP